MFYFVGPNTHVPDEEWWVRGACAGEDTDDDADMAVVVVVGNVYWRMGVTVPNGMCGWATIARPR